MDESQLSLIVALVSLCVPLLTAVINVLYQLWVRHLDRKQKEYEEQVKPIENIYLGYLSALGRIVADGTKNITEYGKYFPLVLLYIPEDKRQPFMNLDADMLSLHVIQNIEAVYNEVVSTVQTEIAKLHTKHK